MISSSSGGRLSPRLPPVFDGPDLVIPHLQLPPYHTIPGLTTRDYGRQPQRHPIPYTRLHPSSRPRVNGMNGPHLLALLAGDHWRATASAM